MLQAELSVTRAKKARAWASALKPLAELFATRFREHLPKLTYPVRSGVHSSHRVRAALAYEYASANDKKLAALIRKTRARGTRTTATARPGSRPATISSPRR